jgi:NhaP-type Na+/H+ or K+/H+ antiporter
MNVLEAVLAILVGSVVLSALARKLNAPYPALLAIAGAVVALAPVQTPFRLDPALALALFVAPVLLDAAHDTSLRVSKPTGGPLAASSSSRSGSRSQASPSSRSSWFLIFRGWRQSRSGRL